MPDGEQRQIQQTGKLISLKSNNSFMQEAFGLFELTALYEQR
jgi:hypothetical protein